MQVGRLDQNNDINFKMRLKLDPSVPKEVFAMEWKLSQIISPVEPRAEEVTLSQENNHGCWQYVLAYMDKSAKTFYCMSEKVMEDLATKLSKKFTKRELKRIKAEALMSKNGATAD